MNDIAEMIRVRYQSKAIVIQMILSAQINIELLTFLIYF